MKLYLSLSLTLIVVPSLCFAQFGGGSAVYSQSAGRGARSEQNEITRRALARDEQPPTSTTMFIEASVMMNVKADEYVAVFGLAQEGKTVPECVEKMDSVVRGFSDDLKGLGIDRGEMFVDFVAQTKVYGFEITGEVAKELLVGFELKKSVSIHYKDASLMDKLIAAASHHNIFDLIKVDYLVKDTASIQNRLAEKAARIIKQKSARHQRLFGIRLRGPGQVYADKPGSYYPAEMYENYVANESEEIDSSSFRQKYIIQNARKSRTFYFNPLSAKGFDLVINPVVVEPVVQFTLYMKVKYDIEQPNKTAGSNQRKPATVPTSRFAGTGKAPR